MFSVMVLFHDTNPGDSVDGNVHLMVENLPKNAYLVGGFNPSEKY